jgi:hypothetical protein
MVSRGQAQGSSTLTMRIHLRGAATLQISAHRHAASGWASIRGFSGAPSGESDLLLTSGFSFRARRDQISRISDSFFF